MNDNWIFSIRFQREGYGGYGSGKIERHAVVGPACIATVEAALRVDISDAARVDIRAHDIVRRFVEGKLDRSVSGYQMSSMFHAMGTWWNICIGSVHEVVDA